MGAGTGATVGKLPDPGAGMKGGFGTASERHGELVVGAVAAVNSLGTDRRARRVADRLEPRRPGRAGAHVVDREHHARVRRHERPSDAGRAPCGWRTRRTTVSRSPCARLTRIGTATWRSRSAPVRSRRIGSGSRRWHRTPSPRRSVAASARRPASRLSGRGRDASHDADAGRGRGRCRDMSPSAGWPRRGPRSCSASVTPTPT